MKRINRKQNFISGIILTILVINIGIMAKSESLYYMQASQTGGYSEPKSLYGSVRARSLGDLLTIALDESVTSNDSLQFSSSRDSTTVDNFTNLINRLLPGKIFNNNINNYGGSNEVLSNTSTSRALNFKNNVAVQVVQVMPNGNLVVQGKKTIMSANERMDLLVSGIVDPRWISNAGVVSSKNVANLQFAMSSQGSTSRGGNEGIINRAIRYLF